MIRAEQLAYLTSLTPTNLTSILAASGYSGCEFESAEFLGLTNGGQFCYKVTYKDEDGVAVGKVFVSRNEQGISADF
jgi:hypothetical protein